MPKEKTPTETAESAVNPQITDAVTQESPIETSQLDELYAKRMGNIEVTLSPADLKYLKNTLVQKVEWKGSNEAYLYLMATISLTQALEGRDAKSEERFSASLPTSSVESINFFLNRVTGKGEESAHRMFAVAMLLRPAIEKINSLDMEIKKLEEASKS
jgi:hypothetical protein